MIISRPSVMFDDSVYAPINQCKATGLEKQINHISFPTGDNVYLFRDCFGRHRITLMRKGENIAGVLLNSSGEIEYKQTCEEHRGNNLTRQLQACLTLFGIHWKRSNTLTKAGAACYKEDICYECSN